MMTNEIVNFRPPLSFYAPTIFRIALVSSISFLLGLLISERNTDIYKLTKVLLLGTSILFVSSVIIGIIYSLFHKVSVYKDGISSYNPNKSWSKSFLDWKSINKAEHKKVGGRRYIMVTSEDKARQLWIPYSLNKKNSMIHLVSKHLGNENELVKILMSDV